MVSERPAVCRHEAARTCLRSACRSVLDSPVTQTAYAAAGMRPVLASLEVRAPALRRERRRRSLLAVLFNRARRTVLRSKVPALKSAPRLRAF